MMVISGRGEVFAQLFLEKNPKKTKPKPRQATLALYSLDSLHNIGNQWINCSLKAVTTYFRKSLMIKITLSWLFHLEF